MFDKKHDQFEETNFSLKKKKSHNVTKEGIVEVLGGDNFVP
jgi:hypothetical protein